MKRWLAREHVAKWWGDPADTLRFVDQQAPSDQAIIAVDDTPVGYICWQPIPAEEREAAGLISLPTEHVDIDVFIGEPAHVGQGVGTAALRLLIDRLEEKGIPSIGLAAAVDNPRALRAYRKAGFRPIADFVEDGRRMRYFCLARRLS